MMTSTTMLDAPSPVWRYTTSDNYVLTVHRLPASHRPRWVSGCRSPDGSYHQTKFLYTKILAILHTYTLLRTMRKDAAYKKTLSDQKQDISTLCDATRYQLLKRLDLAQRINAVSHDNIDDALDRSMCGVPITPAQTRPPMTFKMSHMSPVSDYPGSLCPYPKFRWKHDRLQQAHTDPRGGSRTYWIDVPTVPDTTSDVP